MFEHSTVYTIQFSLFQISGSFHSEVSYFIRQLRNFHIVWNVCLLLCLQELSTGPTSEPNESSSHTLTPYFCETHFNVTVIDILVVVLLLMLRPVSVVEGMPNMKSDWACGRILCDEYSGMLGCGVDSGLYCKGWLCIHLQGLKVPQNVWNHQNKYSCTLLVC